MRNGEPQLFESCYESALQLCRSIKYGKYLLNNRVEFGNREMRPSRVTVCDIATSIVDALSSS